MEASLYIHIPFCGSLCDYCDFYSVPVSRKTGSSNKALDPSLSDPRLTLFTKALLSEAERLFKEFSPGRIPTVYIGGGTPSILGSAGILTLLNGLNRLIQYRAPMPEEITVEANPESADEAFLEAARKGGASRLSLGLQTFHGPSRRAVNRTGFEPFQARTPSAFAQDSLNEKRLSKRLALAAEYFPGALSVDIISGLPFQSEKILLDDIHAALTFKLAHVSLYALTLEPGTPLAERGAAGSCLPSCDEADRLWLCGRDALEKAGYAQYEVSNFCLEGKESRHNIRYWLMRNWLALGPAASGSVFDDEAGTGFRYTVAPNVDQWVGDHSLRESLDRLTLIKETFLMGFRYIHGPDADLFKRRFRLSIDQCIPQTLKVWRNKGLTQEGKTALTKEGLLFLDSFLTQAFGELESRAFHDER